MPLGKPHPRDLHSPPTITNHMTIMHVFPILERASHIRYSATCVFRYVVRWCLNQHMLVCHLQSEPSQIYGF
jgi:hypothetical protein